MRRVSWSVTAGVILLGAVAGLTGCGATPPPVPTHTTTAAPVFASDEEALAAAEEAYGKFVQVSDAVSHDGGADADRLRAVAMGAALEEALAGAAEYSSANAHAIGDSRFEVHALQSASYASVDSARVDIYVCDDVSDVDVLDASGASIVNKERVNRVPFTVGLRFDQDDLKVASKSLWGGTNYCA